MTQAKLEKWVLQFHLQHSIHNVAVDGIYTIGIIFAVLQLNCSQTNLFHLMPHSAVRLREKCVNLGADRMAETDWGG